MATLRTYNMVLQETDICPEGELLTDKELERLKANNRRRFWPNTERVKVYNTDVYFFFGARFTTVIQKILKQ